MDEKQAENKSRTKRAMVNVINSFITDYEKCIHLYYRFFANLPGNTA